VTITGQSADGQYEEIPDTGIFGAEKVSTYIYSCRLIQKAESFDKNRFSSLVKLFCEFTLEVKKFILPKFSNI
jgi:hypothetical protein